MASSSPMPATTMSPSSAVCWTLATTRSPSRIPASIMDSPLTLSMKSSPSPVRSAGRGMTSSTFSLASTPVPAATSPTSGTWQTGRRSMMAPEPASHRTSMALGLVGSRLRYPSFCSELRCECTVEGEVSPTASPISRTDGGYPRSRMVASMCSRIWR